MRNLLIAALMALLMVSCEDEVTSKIAIDVNFKDQCVTSGDILDIPILVVSSDGVLTRLVVESFDSERGLQSLLDVEPGTLRYSDQMYYTVPDFKQDSMELKFKFSATSASGYQRSVQRSLTVLRRDGEVVERTGVTLYCDSHYGQYPDAYSFKLMQPVIRTVADSAQVDLYVPDDIAPGDDGIVRTWMSNTDLEFALNNSFDFAGATTTTLEAAYSVSVHQSMITELRSGDIVLVGRRSQPLGAIQVANIYPSAPGQYDARYILNIKVIGAAL